MELKVQINNLILPLRLPRHLLGGDCAIKSVSMDQHRLPRRFSVSLKYLFLHKFIIKFNISIKSVSTKLKFAIS